MINTVESFRHTVSANSTLTIVGLESVSVSQVCIALTRAVVVLCLGRYAYWFLHTSSTVGISVFSTNRSIVFPTQEVSEMGRQSEIEPGSWPLGMGQTFDSFHTSGTLGCKSCMTFIIIIIIISQHE